MQNRVTLCDCLNADAYSIGPRPSGIGPPPTGAPAATPGAGPGPAPPQAADAGQDAYVTGKLLPPIWTSGHGMLLCL